MKATFRIIETADIEATMTLTMPVSEWKALKNQLPHAWPGYKLSSAIQELVNKVEATFTTEYNPE